MQKLVHRHMIESDLVALHAARCMDGSAGGFYFVPAVSTVNSTRLVVHVEGGGECRTARACSTWAFHSGSSVDWPEARMLPQALARVWPDSPMDPSPVANPDFHDWAKLFVPYCSGDLHSGTRRERSEELGGWYFAGHNLLVGALAQMRRLWPHFEPSEVLVTGSSAGGIAVLMHADWFATQWPRARIKVSPEAGLFYPDVRACTAALGPRSHPTHRFVPSWRRCRPSGMRKLRGGHR